jgi:PncC family amidohydrolase
MNEHCPELARALGEALRKRGLWLVTAESCTGGLIAATLTDVPGASAWFKGGIVAYANEVKERLLDVPAPLLAMYGAVSSETVRAMAEGVCRRLDADVGIAVSGVAGPTGGSPEKPVGSVHIAVAVSGELKDALRRFPGDRAEVRFRTVETALRMALDMAEGLGLKD